MPHPIVTETVQVGSVEIGGGQRFALIAGPCVIENDEHPFFMAEKIQAITRDLGVPYIFKASFDKANRTALDSFRGPGMEEGLAILKGTRRVRVTTDSQYVRQGVTQWVARWKANGWKTASKSPVKNRDLWERLDRLAALHDIEWVWVKGHSGHVENERVDRAANVAIDELLRTGQDAAG